MQALAGGLEQFFEAFRKSLSGNEFVRLNLRNYQGADNALRQILVKRATIRGKEQLSLTYRYLTRDVVKNFDLPEGEAHLIEQMGSGFRSAYLSTISRDYQLEIKKDGRSILKKHKAAIVSLPGTAHDEAKARLIEAGGPGYLFHLGITNASGEVLKHAQDKFRQINHYLELLRPLLEGKGKEDVVRVMDMGSGKGYLTFALYDYLRHTLGTAAMVTGVEYRQDMVDLCNKVAADNGFNGLAFRQGSIEEARADGMDMVIALHACDTATDEALFKGIQAGAAIIVVAPCCHKQIRREMEKAHAHTPLDFMLRYGVYLEREAEMLTDSLRALLLEYHGYSVKIMEFVSAAHTPKNTMITATKGKQPSAEKQQQVLEQIRQAKALFGIERHYLERLLGKS